MNAEALTKRLNAQIFRCSHCCPYEFCQTTSDETEHNKSVDAFSGFDLIFVKPKVLFDIPKGGFNLPSVPIVSYNLFYFQCQIGCEHTEIAIRF